MNEEVFSVLEKNGLTKTEVAIYLALIKYGKATAYRISKEAGMYKANTYVALESLVKKNLVETIDENNKKFYKASKPEEIINNLEREKEKIQKILPFISRSISEENEGTSVITGINALFNIFYTFLEKKDTIYAFDIPEYVPDLVKYHIDQFHKKRIKKKIPMYHIYDYEAKDRINYLSKMKYTYAKKGAANRHSITSTIFCGDITLLINWKKGIKVVKIADKDIAETCKQQFEILWDYKEKIN